jgi:hypothetical protein
VLVYKTRQAFSQTTNEPKVEAESVMVKYCFESCSECRRLECGPKRGLSWVLRLFFPPPSKSTEAGRTCLCSGGARFKSLQIQWLYSSPSVALIGRNPVNPSYITDIFLHRSYFSVYLNQITHLEGGTRSSETSMQILTTPQNSHLNNSRPEKLLLGSSTSVSFSTLNYAAPISFCVPINSFDDHPAVGRP